jgi:hypothetical protein
VPLVLAVRDLKIKVIKEKGIIKSLGISTHNTDIAFRSVETGIIDVILFSINAACDMLPILGGICDLRGS